MNSNTKPPLGPDEFVMFGDLLHKGDLEQLALHLPQWDLNTRKVDGVRLIHQVCHSQISAAAFRLLLEQGIDVNAQTGYGGLPIVTFCEKQPLNLEGLKAMVEHGADPNLYDSDRDSNALDMVLRRAADPRVRQGLAKPENQERLKELGWAQSFQEVIDYLISVGAKRSDAEELSDQRGQYDLDRWSTPWALLLVNADAKTTGKAVQELRGSQKIEPLKAAEYEMPLPDVPDDIEPAVVVQMKDHDWTHVVTYPEPTLEDATELSNAIGKSPVVWMIYDDTSECIGWRVLENGEVTEELDTGIGMDMQARFKSSRRRKRPKSFRNEEAMWDFINESLVDLDALLAHTQLGHEQGKGWSLSGPFNEVSVAAAYLVI
ncbi:MAG: hypothetical protein GC159_18240 [Phycisphaera sp.]|nr:hypothetical protein [Phycisphaera sp.]